jgi:signal transduction histidine kinase
MKIKYSNWREKVKQGKINRIFDLVINDWRIFILIIMLVPLFPIYFIFAQNIRLFKIYSIQHTQQPSFNNINTLFHFMYYLFQFNTLSYGYAILLLFLFFVILLFFLFLFILLRQLQRTIQKQKQIKFTHNLFMHFIEFALLTHLTLILSNYLFDSFNPQTETNSFHFTQLISTNWFNLSSILFNVLIILIPTTFRRRKIFFYCAFYCNNHILNLGVQVLQDFLQKNEKNSKNQLLQFFDLPFFLINTIQNYVFVILFLFLLIQIYGLMTKESLNKTKQIEFLLQTIQHLGKNENQGFCALSFNQKDTSHLEMLTANEEAINLSTTFFKRDKLKCDFFQSSNKQRIGKFCDTECKYLLLQNFLNQLKLVILNKRDSSFSICDGHKANLGEVISKILEISFGSEGTPNNQEVAKFSEEELIYECEAKNPLSSKRFQIELKCLRMSATQAFITINFHQKKKTRKNIRKQNLTGNRIQINEEEKIIEKGNRAPQRLATFGKFSVNYEEISELRSSFEDLSINALRMSSEANKNRSRSQIESEPSFKMKIYSFHTNENSAKFELLRNGSLPPLPLHLQNDFNSNSKTSNDLSDQRFHFSKRKGSSSQILSSNFLQNIDFSPIHEEKDKTEKERAIIRLEENINKLTTEVKGKQIYLNMIIHDLRNPVLSLENALDSFVNILKLDSNEDYDESCIITSKNLRSPKKIQSCSTNIVREIENGKKQNQRISDTWTPKILTMKKNYGFDDYRKVDLNANEKASQSVRKYISDNVVTRLKKVNNPLCAKSESCIHSHRGIGNDSLRQISQIEEESKTLNSEVKDHISHELRERLGNIVKGAKLCSFVLTNLINDLLDSAKIANNTFKLFKENANLLQILITTRQILLYQAQLKKIDINLDFGKTKDLQFMDKVFIDENRVRQVIINLISNALKFTLKNGTITIKLRVEELKRGFSNQDPNSPTLILERENIPVRIFCQVSDTGIGIDQENIGKLFSDFATLDEHSQINHSGTGLGLSICKKLIEKMGGTIDVKSQKGEGSDFFFSFPTIYNQQKNAQFLQHHKHSLDLTLLFPNEEEETKYEEKPKVQREEEKVKCSKDSKTEIMKSIDFGVKKSGKVDEEMERKKEEGKKSVLSVGFNSKKDKERKNSLFFKRKGKDELQSSEESELETWGEKTRVVEAIDLGNEAIEEEKGSLEEKNTNSGRRYTDAPFPSTSNNFSHFPTQPSNLLNTSSRKSTLTPNPKYLKNVLLVDDSDILRNMARQLLNQKVSQLHDTDNG